MVYNLASAHKLGLHRLTEAQWLRKEIKKQDQEEITENAEKTDDVIKQDDFIQDQPRQKRKLRFKTRGKFNPSSW